MLRHSLGGEVIDLMPCLQAQGMRDRNKAINFKKGAINCCCDKKNFFPNTIELRIYFCQPKADLPQSCNIFYKINIAILGII